MDPKENGNLPAHPTEEMHLPVDGRTSVTQCVPAQPGLTKREHFAAMAMQGFCAHETIASEDVRKIAKYAVEQADALLRALAAGGEG